MKKETYSIMILDDQLTSTALIEYMLCRLDYIKIVHRSQDPIEALKLLKLQPVDILFLDMDMPTMMGWEFANLLDPRPVIIVISGYTDFAYQAHEIGAKGYLRKIPSWDLLRRTLSDAIREVDFIDSVTKNGSTFVKLRRYKAKNEESIHHHEIRYATVLDKELTLFLKQQQTFVSLASLNYLMDQLPSNKFVRISASQMVAIDEIRIYSKTQVELKDGDEILTIHKPNAYYAIDNILNGLNEDGL
ncbi:response regulator transcription factor [Sphingobacterium shayense]|uniref:LytR/AlgR family response regulator transcription factor n=1 Tax=Sphingobacterium shayense TaxID=626343 RepID=UPI001556828D|nr:LytTR family DNA-binding domain-containing protein [Sphingobacterium shayense]NQD69975.1 response regulator transcription factor [Sphingobacterium shayense]